MKNEFSKRLKELRTSLSLTQSEFASIIGTSQNALSNYEKGERNPSYEIIMAISEQFEVSVDWLLGLSSKKFLGIETYADAFQLLIELCSTKYVDKKSSIIFPIFRSDSLDTLFIASEDPNFHTFFKEFRKIFELHESGTIDDELYQLWIEKELSKYTFALNKLPECFN